MSILAHILPTGWGEKVYTAQFYLKKTKKSFWLLELGEKVFLESGGWDEWQTFENQSSFDLKTTWILQ